MSEIPLLLFAKAPVSGQVKTRLQPECSPAQAAAIAEILLHESLIKATQHWPGKVLLSAPRDDHDRILPKLADKYGVDLVEQTEGDLGEKMYAAFERYGYPAAILGCDAPQVQARDLALAYAELQAGNNVIGPSMDGGYYLIGLAQMQSALFKDIAWGSERVLQQTIAAATKADTKLHHITALNDVDLWQDLLELAPEFAALKQYLISQGL